MHHIIFQLGHFDHTDILQRSLYQPNRSLTIFFLISDSIRNDHVTLMQIECSVVNTTLVQLKSDTLPESLRKKNNELLPTKQQLYNNVKPVGNVTKPRIYDNPKPKYNASKRTKKDSVDASLSNLHNSNANTSSSHQPVKHNTNNVDVGKNDSFANYLFYKYETSKNDSVNIENNNGTVLFDVNVRNGTKSP